MPDAALPAQPAQATGAVRTAVPPGIAQVLYVLNFLIAYACHIAAAAEHCAVRGDISPVAIAFAKGITVEALIIRVARGLRRALALQEMLRQRAATGQDIAPVPPRRSGGGGGHSRPAKDRPPQPERLPSAAEIAAELQRRPVGAIVAQICHDIGIAPEDLTEAQWDALQAVIDTYGGSREKLWPSMRNRIVARFEAYAADPLHTEIPRIPLIPCDRMARIAARHRTGPPP
jgi:hypothetical protein